MDRIHTPTQSIDYFFSVSLPYTRERGESIDQERGIVVRNKGEPPKNPVSL